MPAPFPHPATRIVGSAAARLLESYELGEDPDEDLCPACDLPADICLCDEFDEIGGAIDG